ncbi:MAG: alpha/beta fold hydrolase [Phototrophicaceae bacterium]
MPNLEHHIVQRAGWRWHVTASGNEAHPPLLLLHCWTGNWREWERLIPYLTPHYRVLALDQLGFGQSDKPTGDHYRIPQQAERAHHILRHFGYERATLIGHSMGGQTALTLAAYHPESVEKLVVISPPITGKLHPLSRLGMPFTAPARAGWTYPQRTLIEMAQAVPSVGVHFGRFYFPRPTEQAEQSLYWMNQLNADDQAQSCGWALYAITHWDVTPLLAKVSAPLLGIWGDQDYCVDADESAIIAAHAPNVRHILRIPRVGHFPLVEAWDESLTAIMQFLVGQASDNLLTSLETHSEA